MATVDYIDYRELRDGANHPDGRPDILNRVYRALWTTFTTEHQKSGAHRTDLATHLSKVEVISWAGNDADDRDISLSDGTLDITFIHVFSGASETYLKTENMAGDTTKPSDNTAYQADYVQSVGTGTFQVGTSLNASGTTYIAIVLGV